MDATTANNVFYFILGFIIALAIGIFLGAGINLITTPPTTPCKK